MYKIFPIITIIAVCRASGFPIGLGFNGGFGQGDNSLSGLGPSQSDQNSQQNLLNKDPNLKQNSNWPFDVPIQVHYNRQQPNGVQIQEQQVPKILEQILNASPENDRPVVVDRQNWGDLMTYFVPQPPKNGQQAQNVGQQPQSVANQRQQLFDQRPQLLEQRKPENSQKHSILNKSFFNMNPHVVEQSNPDNQQTSQEQDEQRQGGVLVDRRQPIILGNKRQLYFQERQPNENTPDVVSAVIGHRQPVEQRDPNLEQRSPVANHNPFMTQQFTHFGQNQQNLGQLQQNFGQLQQNLGQLQPVLEQRGFDVNQRQQLFDQQRQLLLEQRQPENVQRQSVLNERYANIRPLVIEQRNPDNEQNDQKSNQEQDDGQRGVLVDRRQPIFFDNRQLVFQQTQPNEQQTLPVFEQRFPVLEQKETNQQRLPAPQYRPLLMQELSQFINQNQQNLGQRQPVVEQNAPTLDQTQNQRVSFFFGNLPEAPQTQPNDAQQVSDPNAGAQNTSPETNLQWGVETMVPELRNADWWRSDKMNEARASIARAAAAAASRAV